MRAIDRRTFLSRGAALGLGAAAWACTRGKKASTGADALSIFPTAQQGLASGDSRNGLVVFRGQKLVVPKAIRVRLVPPNGQPFEVPVQRERVMFGSGGSQDKEQPQQTEATDIYVFRHDFDPGVWGIQAIVDNQAVEAAFQIDAKAPAPMVGGRALPSQSPTTSNAHAVDPICTRTPACSMHQLTIADALKASKPLIVTFATPRFCKSRTCGPTVDLIEDQKKRVGDKVNFVHVEIYRNAQVALTPNGDSPTFAEWKLAVEPWTYFIGANGVVKDRWLGSMGTDELTRAVDALSA